MKINDSDQRKNHLKMYGRKCDFHLIFLGIYALYVSHEKILQDILTSKTRIHKVHIVREMSRETVFKRNFFL